MSTAPNPEKMHLTLAERVARGKHLRKKVPRSAHAQWQPAANRPDAVRLLESSNAGRVPELIPIRFGRMLPSPFTFLRGSAGAMAFDLAETPATGIHVQLCGDCHLMNFGGFATPERNFIFDLTDFDETLVGPWEWDVKRLVASVVAAARASGFSDRQAKEAAIDCARSYRQQMHILAAMHTLDVWYARMDGKVLLDLMPDAKGNRNGQMAGKLRPHPVGSLLTKITEIVDGQRRFRDVPPLIYHPPQEGPFEKAVHQFLARYRETLQDDRRTLLARYHAVDLAMKVVGVGSVGTRCAILLLMADTDDALILQYKEAGPSVLEPFLGKSRHRNHGQRVVCGQRLLQSASDLFLGWSSDEQGMDFYFRQLRDMKTSVRLDGMTAAAFRAYAELCGATLARAHAKAGDPALISGYLGRSEVFDHALAAFARTYADQNERDHAAMVQAVRSGHLIAHVEAGKETATA